MQEYPKWLYHPRHGGKIFYSPEETKWLWLFGWRDKPFPPKEERLLYKIRNLWQEWKWIIVALSSIFGLILVMLKLFDRIFK